MLAVKGGGQPNLVWVPLNISLNISLEVGIKGHYKFG